MQLKLIKTLVKSLEFNQIDIDEDFVNKLDFSLSASWDEGTPLNFNVLFDFELFDDSGYKLNLKYEGVFETDSNVDESFMSSQWPQVNGAAILYPFMRAFVSTVTVNSGFDAAIIPSVNFQKMYSDKIKNINESE
jgi:preprotein translocase subunit SecB